MMSASASTDAMPILQSEHSLESEAPPASPRTSQPFSKVQDYVKRHRNVLGIASVIVVALLGHVLAVYYLYYRCHPENGCRTLRIFALNTWGMPARLGSRFKEERMAAIADVISEAKYDIYLLEELWMEADHNTVARAAANASLYMTGFRQLALGTCDGRLGPEFCSGLAVISRFPFARVHFESYTYHGDPLKATIDGEWLARKGVGKVSLDLKEIHVDLDLFVTHTAADPDPKLHDYTNFYYREKQVEELMSVYVDKSEADVVVLGGDFNAEPNGKVYNLVKSKMKNCIGHLFNKFWTLTRLATYGNPKNTFSALFGPVIYDYLFFRVQNDELIVWTDWFQVPSLQTLLTATKRISLSDHEAVTTTLRIWNPKAGKKKKNRH